MQEITSISNNLIKETAKLQQKKFRKQTSKFLLEGQKPIFEAIDAGIEIKQVFLTQKNLEKFTQKTNLQDKIILVNDAIIEKISTTETAPEAVAVAKQINYKLENLKSTKRLALVENIKDSGNLGTIIRSAAAFGIEGIILCGETTDIFNPKVVRSAVGALFKMPITKANLAEVKEQFPNHNFIATVVNHSDIISPDKIDFSKPFILMLGSEANGLTDDAIKIANIKTTIPMTNLTESLNLSIAASILFYISAQ